MHSNLCPNVHAFLRTSELLLSGSQILEGPSTPSAQEMSAPTCTGETPSASSHQSVEKEEKADKDKTTEGSNEEDEEYRVLAERYKDEGNAAFKEGR